MLSYEEISNVDKYGSKMYDKIHKETGLENIDILWYTAFIDNSCMLDGIVKYEDIKDHMQESLSLAYFQDTNHGKKYIKEISKDLPKVLKLFEKKKLIDYKSIEDGKVFPRIIGYNYLNDPEFYLAYRKKGEREWPKRLSTLAGVSDIVRCLNCDYEFREKKVINSFFN